MKVLALIIASLVGVLAKGSGPYLPSGWRPDGPVFYLPSEAAVTFTKPSDNPLKEVILQESEASGSDFLREYGPPKLQEALQGLTKQALPDETFEQEFVNAVVESKGEKVESTAAVVTDVVNAAVESKVGELESIAAVVTDVVNAAAESTGEEVESTAGVVADVVNAAAESTGEEVGSTAGIVADVVNAAVESTGGEGKSTAAVVTEVLNAAVESTGGEIENTAIVVAKVTEDNVEVNSKVKSTEEVVALVTESQVIDENITTADEIESDTNTEVESVLENFEVTTEANIIVADVTVANIVEGESVNEEAISTNEPTQASVDATQEVVNVEKTVSQILEESVVLDAQQEESGSLQESTSFVSEHNENTNVESSAVIAQIEAEVKYEVVSAVEKKIQSVVEEVKKVEEVVQNIPQVIVALENEVNAQQAEALQEVPIVVEETFGFLDQGHEGFLEYGPPGFQEYGPPKDDLNDAALEESAPEVLSITSNEVRRRRFSPKFWPAKRSH